MTNVLSPKITNPINDVWVDNNDPNWQECNGTGYSSEKPLWMTVWLFIIADNTLHIICNGVAIYLWR